MTRHSSGDQGDRGGCSDHVARRAANIVGQLLADERYTWAELEGRFNQHARKLAREAGEQATSLTWRQLQRIAAGETTRPRPATARVLEQMFGYPIVQLLAPEPSPEVPPGDDDWAEDMRRRALLGATGGVAIGSVLSALDPVRRELDAAFQGAVTEHDAVEWERAADEYSRLIVRPAAGQVLPDLLIGLQ